MSDTPAGAAGLREGDRPSAAASRLPWIRIALGVVGLAVLLYLPTVLTERAIFGVRLSNMQVLNLGLTQVNLMLISMLGALSLNYLTGCAGLTSIGHAAFITGETLVVDGGNQIWGDQWTIPRPDYFGGPAA